MSRKGRDGRRSLQGPTCEIHPPTHRYVPRDADRRFDRRRHGDAHPARTRPEAGALPALSSGRPRGAHRDIPVSALAQRPRAVYRVYDEQDYVSGAVGLDCLVAHRHSGCGGVAVAVSALLVAGLASAAVIAIQALRVSDAKRVAHVLGAPGEGAARRVPSTAARGAIASLARGVEPTRAMRVAEAPHHLDARFTRSSPPASSSASTARTHTPRPVVSVAAQATSRGATDASDRASAVRRPEFGFER